MLLLYSLRKTSSATSSVIPASLAALALCTAVVTFPAEPSSAPHSSRILLLFSHTINGSSSDRCAPCCGSANGLFLLALNLVSFSLSSSRPLAIVCPSTLCLRSPIFLTTAALPLPSNIAAPSNIRPMPMPSTMFFSFIITGWSVSLVLNGVSIQP